MRRHVTYANVLATVALFISLGGASYAGITLAPHSVTPSKLSFGLASAARTDRSTHTITVTQPNCAPGPDGIVPPCPPKIPRPITTTVHLTTRAPGRLLVTGRTQLISGDHPAQVSLTATADDHNLPGEDTATVPTGSHSVEATYLSSAALPAGHHTVILSVVPSANSGTLTVSPISLTAVTLPR